MEHGTPKNLATTAIDQPLVWFGPYLQIIDDDPADPALNLDWNNPVPFSAATFDAAQCDARRYYRWLFEIRATSGIIEANDANHSQSCFLKRPQRKRGNYTGSFTIPDEAGTQFIALWRAPACPT